MLALNSDIKSVEATANKMEALLLQYGVKAEIKRADTYTAVQAIIEDNPDYDNIVLLERVSRDRKISLKELTDLTEERELNVIPIIDVQHKGTDYCRELYAAGITSALFDAGNGVNPWDITEVIRKKRTRRDAKIYYGIAENVVAEGTLSDLMINDKLKYLTNGNMNEIGRRYIDCVVNMTRSQNLEFLRYIPKEILSELVNTSEFEQAKKAINSSAEGIKIQLEPRYEVAVYEPAKVSFFAKLFGNRKGKKAMKKARREQKQLEKRNGKNRKGVKDTIDEDYRVVDVMQYMSAEEKKPNMFGTKEVVEVVKTSDFVVDDMDVVNSAGETVRDEERMECYENQEGHRTINMSSQKRNISFLEDEPVHSSKVVNMSELAELL